MKAKLIKHGHSYALVLDEKLVAFAHPEDFRSGIEIGKLSLKNCQAIERGYDLDELAENFWKEEFMKSGLIDTNSYKKGFQKCLELMGDKKYSEDDVILIAEYVRVASQSSPSVRTKYLLAEYQSQEQTEWEVEIITFTEDDLKSVSEDWGKLGKPKLDADGCLILKRI